MVDLILLLFVAIAGAQEEMPNLDEAQPGEITGIIPLIFGQAMPVAADALVQKVDSVLTNIAADDDTWRSNIDMFIGNNSTINQTVNLTA